MSEEQAREMWANLNYANPDAPPADWSQLKPGAALDQKFSVEVSHLIERYNRNTPESAEFQKHIAAAAQTILHATHCRDTEELKKFLEVHDQLQALVEFCSHFRSRFPTTPVPAIFLNDFEALFWEAVYTLENWHDLWGKEEERPTHKTRRDRSPRRRTIKIQ